MELTSFFERLIPLTPDASGITPVGYLAPSSRGPPALIISWYDVFFFFVLTSFFERLIPLTPDASGITPVGYLAPSSRGPPALIISWYDVLQHHCPKRPSYMPRKNLHPEKNAAQKIKDTATTQHNKAGHSMSASTSAAKRMTVNIMQTI